MGQVSPKKYSVPIYLKSIVISSKPQLNLANNRYVQQISTEETAHRVKTNNSWGESSSYENK